MSAEIVDLTVTKEKTVSLRVRLTGSDITSALQELREVKGISQRYSIVEAENSSPPLYFDGKIHSINIVQGARLVFHAPYHAALILKAVSMFGQPAYLRFQSQIEHDVSELLHRAAIRENVDKRDILYRLTTFTKDGAVREGKRSVYDVSEAQLKVVLDKLRKIVYAA